MDIKCGDILFKIITAKSCITNTHKLFRIKLLSQNTKLKIYQTILGPILGYVAEALKMTSKKINALRVEEGKKIRKIYGPIKEESWKIKTNKGIQDTLQTENTVK